MGIPKKWISLFAGVLMTLSVHSQTRVIHGTLTAFNSFPVQNVEVRSRKCKTAILSDSLGRFDLVCMKDDVIRIKPKAFRAVNAKVGPDTDSLDIDLVFIDTPRNREIAVGYGYVKESDLTSAISNLQQENDEYCHYADIYDVIRGRFAGVTIESGQVIIRGTNSFNASNEALYVVDNMIVSTIDWIVPCDIRSISIIKDGASAAYGSRGSNGVVIIETKRGG